MHMLEQTLCPCENATYLEEFHHIVKTMICEMTSARLKDSISYNFIVQMIPHHEGAVQMSKLTLLFRICPQLKPILQAIIKEQEQGICEMEDLLRNCPASAFQNSCN